METEPQSNQRPKGTIWILALCVFVGLVVFALVGLEHGEPSIRGRKLTDWIDRVMFEPAGSPVRLAAKRAILDIGTNAIPHLLFCLEGKETMKDKVADFLMKKGYVRSSYWVVGHQAFVRRPFYGASGFEVLGTNAVSALPQLVKLLDQPLDQTTNRPMVEIKPFAASSLAFLGREGQLQLLSRFPGSDKSYQHIIAANCVLAFGKVKYFEPEVLQAVFRYATNSNSDDKRMALSAIRNLEGNLDLKRALLDWALKSGWDFQYADALRMLESNPELIPEFRARVAGVPGIKDPDAIAIQTRLLASPRSDRE